MIQQFTLSVSELVKLWGRFGASDRSLQRWSQKGVIQKDGSDRYDVISVASHLLNNLQERADRRDRKEQSDGELSELALRKLAAQVRELEATAELRELERDKQKELLVPAAEVLEAWTNKVLAARAKFLGLPSRLAAELAGESDPALVELRLKTVIDEALWELGGAGNQSG